MTVTLDRAARFSSTLWGRLRWAVVAALALTLVRKMNDGWRLITTVERFDKYATCQKHSLKNKRTILICVDYDYRGTGSAMNVFTYDINKVGAHRSVTTLIGGTFGGLSNCGSEYNDACVDKVQSLDLNGDGFNDVRIVLGAIKMKVPKTKEYDTDWLSSQKRQKFTFDFNTGERKLSAAPNNNRESKKLGHLISPLD